MACVYSGIKCLQMIKKLFLILLICNIAMTAFSQSLIVGTFNLRYDNPRDTGNLWKDRAPVAAALIRFHQFDIVGTQEGLKNQLDDLQAALPAYAFTGRAGTMGNPKGNIPLSSTARISSAYWTAGISGSRKRLKSPVPAGMQGSTGSAPG
jgi:hypothetical protein